MLIETFDETKTTVLRTSWRFQNDEQEYLTVGSACDSPFCGCSELTFGIGTGLKTKAMASFKFDAATKEVREIGLDNSSRLLSQRLVSELSPADKDILVQIFRSIKFKNEEEFDVDGVEPPDFPIQEIEEKSLMIEYKRIFPWAREHWITVGEEAYLVFDQYCLNSTCNCQSVSLTFEGYRDEVCFGRDDPTVIVYTANTGTWEAREVGKKAQPPSVLMKELLSRYPDLRDVLAQRRKKLLRLYARHREQKGFAVLPANSIPRPPAVGRNEPCPCGSGRKYKKCCGGEP
jgi:hypothetical protein